MSSLDGPTQKGIDSKSGTTHFGFQEVLVEEKPRMVAAVFDFVASRYDLVNDVLSLGIHRLWRRTAMRLSGVGPGDRVLDVAGGTGDFTTRLAAMVGHEGLVVLAEINDTMLQLGRARLESHIAVGNVRYVQADAESLPFSDDCFDCVTIGFGLRNVTDQDAALESMHRVLKPGGPMVVLEFSHPTVRGFQPFYDFYSFKVMPLVGRVITGGGSGFRYLAESIRVGPDQERLKEMMGQAGFERCEYFNLSGGIVAVHRGYREQ